MMTPCQFWIACFNGTAGIEPASDCLANERFAILPVTEPVLALFILFHDLRTA